MNIFTPAFYSIANISTEKLEPLLTDLKEEFRKDYPATDSFYDLGFDALAFVNKHPEAPELLIEIQALTEEARDKGMEIASKIASSVADLTLTWIDVTQEALQQRNAAKEQG